MALTRFFLLAALGAALGCDRLTPPQEKKIEVLIPWSQNGEKPSLQRVKLKTLPNPYYLKGQVAEIFVDVRLNFSEFSGSVARPNLLRTDNDLYVPTDEQSALALSAYAHMEKLKELDDRLGIGHRLKWPRRLGVDINFTGEFDNAAFLMDMDAITIAKRSLADLPMAMNGAVLAHEHFHAHFYEAFSGPTFRDLGLTNRIRVCSEDSHDMAPTLRYNLFLLQAWNEGLADFWSYVYTGSPDAYQYSFPEELEERSLDRGLASLGAVTRNEFPIDKPSKKSCNYYAVGTQLARTLKRIVEDQGEVSSEARELWARRVVERLPWASGQIPASLDETRMNPHDILVWLFAEEELTDSQCGLLNRVAENSYDFCRRSL